ncbi:uncharacterized protein PITG_16155 [Phytophthora infestans T30-4]|uniref:KATNIP domain-containing protein n=1 Tax=Phytophthora infestans (strain T30-4) TaxID=403677 RepID=D0NT07_PHYIT|nr:uncharacterized protein PITG_16155 [Phytophthora infestans T30-4]EEY64719.1 conserved hypothetical protein [Phytophthora infestans T30-4]|eukprot:XP_002897919.1 conserved hypothetical protein [Phytophthora infestans T30-4]
MAERKRWDKQQDFHPPSSSYALEAKADPVLTKQLQYIKVLEERNRVKKRLAAASKKNDRLHEREEAFVTAFNVPTRAAQSTSSSSLSSRNTRSATTILPTKLPGKLSKCKSAPSTTLNYVASGSEEKEKNAVRRAKWSRPKAPMDVAVKHEDGMPLFRLTTHEEKIEEKDGEGEEDSYLEESFEEFEEEDEKEHTLDLSKTTKELFAIIQHLSRSKQRALVDVLQKFQSGEQNENDVKVLQSSIGDPEIWKEISATLNTPKPLPNERDSEFSEAVSAASVAPVNNLVEQQLQLEDEYEKEIKERLFHEREEKHRVLNEAAERRAKMMKQLEDEEREIERLMEVKRQERLAKLRALQDETSATGATFDIHVKLLSTWGRTRAVGLTQICVYDLNGDDLSVDLETLQLHDQPTGRPLPKTNDMVRGLQRLFNGVAQTNKEKEMWLGRFGDAGVLVIRFQVPSSPSKLCVWNFNSRSHIACTRDVEVLVSGKTVWTGSLPETFGDEDDNICTWIDLLGSAKKTSRTSRNEKSSWNSTVAIWIDSFVTVNPAITSYKSI